MNTKNALVARAQVHRRKLAARRAVARAGAALDHGDVEAGRRLYGLAFAMHAGLLDVAEALRLLREIDSCLPLERGSA